MDYTAGTLRRARVAPCKSRLRLNVVPSAPKRTFNRTLDLAKLQALADKIIAEEHLPPGPDSEHAMLLAQECGVHVADSRLETIGDRDVLVRDRWYAVAKAAGASEADCAKISGVFAYQGFRLELQS